MFKRCRSSSVDNLLSEYVVLFVQFWFNLGGVCVCNFDREYYEENLCGTILNSGDV